jgi:hypothetical protein
LLWGQIAEAVSGLEFPPHVDGGNVSVAEDRATLAPFRGRPSEPRDCRGAHRRIVALLLGPFTMKGNESLGW